VLVPEALLQAVEKPSAVLTPVEAKEQKTAVPVKPKRRPDPKPKRRDRHKESTAASARSRASALSQQSSAQSVTGSIASANYRSIVAAELNRRKFYPPAARSSGANGVVVVTFTVGGDGRIARHAITRSSGQPALDSAVHQMMAAVSLPPPPGGSFRATVPIRFDITP
jgi:protein TonB